MFPFRYREPFWLDFQKRGQNFPVFLANLGKFSLILAQNSDFSDFLEVIGCQ